MAKISHIFLMIMCKCLNIKFIFNDRKYKLYCCQTLLFFRSPEDPDQQPTYTFTFTVKFPHDDDEVYLAHCYPYTYTDLQDYLSELSCHPVKSTYSSVRLLCKSLAGNNVYYVTITSPIQQGEIKVSIICY